MFMKTVQGEFFCRKRQKELTDVPADPAHDLSFGQLGDPEAAVPVSPAEQQPAVIGHHQNLSADLHSGGKRSTQETLSSKKKKKKIISRVGSYINYLSV